LPVIGGLVSGARDAYTYLPDSVSRFPGAPQLASEIESVGFAQITYRYMTLGTVALHLARKPGQAKSAG
jgi:demethylmenaquinone methyltransferase/2-methoxy-6-polyprenyl-1,4-benzoquinol methylase